MQSKRNREERQKGKVGRKGRSKRGRGGATVAAKRAGANRPKKIGPPRGAEHEREAMREKGKGEKSKKKKGR